MNQDRSVSRRNFIVSASALTAAGIVARGQTAPATQANDGHMMTPTSRPARGASSATARTFTVPTPASPTWPVLTRYDDAHLRRIAMPMGGIGTGTVSLGGRGDLRDWELVNKPAKRYTPEATFFALWCKPQNGPAVTRCLEGPFDDMMYEGSAGADGRNHGLPRFRQCNFAAAYPLGQVLLSDEAVPLQVRIEAFNPMVPVDSDVSGIPAAIVRFVLINPTNAPIAASVCGTLENYIGWNGDSGKVSKNVNEFRDGEALRGLFMHSKGLDPKHPSWGTLALATTAQQVTHRTAWADAGWGGTLLDFWDDFSDDGKLEERTSRREAPYGSLAASVDVPANGNATVTFLVGWHFPNRFGWNPSPQNERVGNYYCTQYRDAWDAVAKTAPRIDELERKTVEFVRAFVDADLPPVVKEAALYNASTLRTQTVFRTEDGRFYGWEGCNDHDGWCHGNCTHVWNYEQATPHLYGEFARQMRETEFAYATRDNGYMSFRVNIPLAHAKEMEPAAADGQMGSLMKLYRDWRLSGDDQMLRTLWPHAKRALEFAWTPGGWDADRDGVMEGCQHNTMDIEYYGPNPEVGVWYLGALRAAEEMARAVGDEAFAGVCKDLHARGASWMDASLFNGEYYEQKIVPPKDEKSIAPGLRLGAGAKDLAHPELQLGAGCLTDQLVGQYMAHICGLGYLLDKANVRQALASVYKHNFRSSLADHFNNMRTYALADEGGTLVATYPRGDRPKQPFPYAFEVWTGLEYTAAVGMIYEGMIDEALQLVGAVRERFEGEKRSPFDEAECGHHYARAMASWGLILAMTGFHYDGVDQRIRFASAKQPSKWFWSNGNAWGTIEQAPKAGGTDVKLAVMGGSVPIKTLELSGAGSMAFAQSRTVNAGETLALTVTA